MPKKKKIIKKKKAKAKAKETEKFVFENKYPNDTKGDHLKVYVKTGPETYDKDLLCDVRHYDHAGEYWLISAGYSGGEPEFIRDVDRQKFATKEEAAEFALALVRNVKRITETNPLPEDAKRYLQDRMRRLNEEQRALESSLYANRSERFVLAQVAKRDQIDDDENCLVDEVAPGEKALRDFLSLEMDGKDDLIDWIYKKFGKDAGRTYRGALHRLVEALDPVLAEKVDV